MKKIFLILLIASNLSIYAQNNTKEFYLGTNVISPFSAMNLKVAALKALLPLASNLEYGFTLNSGYYCKSHNVELRLTAGQSNSYNFIPQVQIGYNFFVFDYFKQNESGWYLGGFLRSWDYHNKYSKTNLYNLSTNFTIGYTWKKNKIITDIRLNQPLTLFSTTDIENSKSSFQFVPSPMPNFLPVLPFLSVNIGLKL